MMNILLISLGAAIGASLRYNIDRLYKRKFQHNIPIQTLIINVTGSFALGLIVTESPKMYAFFGIGVAGAFTTWSTFALETHQLIVSKKHWQATLYTTLTFSLCLLSSALGIALTK